MFLYKVGYLRVIKDYIRHKPIPSTYKFQMATAFADTSIFKAIKAPF